MPEALLLSAAILVNVVGMGWFALSLDAHWHHVHCGGPRKHWTVRPLRVAGALVLLTSLGLCLAVDHPSMAALVWVMQLTLAALIVAFTLTWRAQWLRAVAPRWVSRLTHDGSSRAPLGPRDDFDDIAERGWHLDAAVGLDPSGKNRKDQT